MFIRLILYMGEGGTSRNREEEWVKEEMEEGVSEARDSVKKKQDRVFDFLDLKYSEPYLSTETQRELLELEDADAQLVSSFLRSAEYRTEITKRFMHESVSELQDDADKEEKQVLEAGALGLYPIWGYIRANPIENNSQESNTQNRDRYYQFSRFLHEKADATTVPLFIDMVSQPEFVSFLKKFERYSTLRNITDAMRLAIKDARETTDTKVMVDEFGTRMERILEEGYQTIPYESLSMCEKVLLSTGSQAALQYLEKHKGSTNDEYNRLFFANPTIQDISASDFGSHSVDKEQNSISIQEEYVEPENNDEYYNTYEGTGLKVHNPYFIKKFYRGFDGFLVRTPENVGVASIDFLPFDRSTYSPDKRTQILLAGYDDFTEFFARMDEGSIRKIDFLTGNTNRQMAKIALMLGFRMIDQGPPNIDRSAIIAELHEGSLSKDYRQFLCLVDECEEKATFQPLESFLEDPAYPERKTRLKDYIDLADQYGILQEDLGSDGIRLVSMLKTASIDLSFRSARELNLRYDYINVTAKCDDIREQLRILGERKYGGTDKTLIEVLRARAKREEKRRNANSETQESLSY